MLALAVAGDRAQRPLLQFLLDTSRLRDASLEEAEEAGRVAAILRWFALQYPGVGGVTIERAAALEQAAAERVVRRLAVEVRDGKLGRCRSCGRTCPPWYPLCERCARTGGVERPGGADIDGSGARRLRRCRPRRDERRGLARVARARRARGGGGQVIAWRTTGLGHVRAPDGTVASSFVRSDRARPGDFFGELALLVDDGAASRACARRRRTLPHDPREDFLALVETEPSFALHLLRELARRLARRARREAARAPALHSRVPGTKLIAENRRARHDYHLLDRVEAGVQLTGTEVKSLREGGAQLAQAYAEIREGEAWLVGATIAEYAQGNQRNHRPERDRKLLLHRREIDSLYGKVREKGLTLVPTRLYFKDGRVKVELALARGKERIDKRRDLAERDAKRQMERALKARR